MDCDDIYTLFLESEDGNAIWQDAYKIFPKHNSSQSDDAADFIYDSFIDWLEENKKLTKIKNNDKWIDTYGDSMYEHIYAGLT